jgi:hypothetical protein
MCSFEENPCRNHFKIFFGKNVVSAATGTQKCFCDTHKSLNSAATGTQKCIIW